MNRLRFGIIGCGNIGRVHARVINEIESASLVAVSDLNSALGHELSNAYGCDYYENYKDMLSRNYIDIVSVCTPSGYHCEVVVEAAKFRKHVIVEKPIDVSLDKADKMIEACKKNNVKLSVVLQHRFDEAVQALKASVDKGALGRLYMGASKTLWYRNEDYYKQSSWRGTLSLDGGGALINQSIHYIDLLQYIMGPVSQVNGFCSRLHHDAIEAEDIGVAMLQFENGAVGVIEGSTVCYPGLCSELTISGEHGSAIIKNDTLDYYKLKSGPDAVFESLISKNEAAVTGASAAEDIDITSHKKYYEDVISAVLSGREPSISGEEGRKSLAVVKAVYESAKNKEWVPLKDL